MDVRNANDLKGLEDEKRRLKRLVAHHALVIQILKEITSRLVQLLQVLVRPAEPVGA